ncbi:hypothetical protein ACSNOC_27340, partial [Streptomyces sp. URMC 129]
MGAAFLTSSAAADAGLYVERFHRDLCGAVAAVAGRPVTGVLRRSGGTVAAADAAVLVALCSPAYYRDADCGLDWAAFERRLGRRPGAARGARKTRLQVLWVPADPPPGLPRAAAGAAGPFSRYAEGGLLEMMRHDRGTDPLGYREVLRDLARDVWEGHGQALPALLPGDHETLTPSFPVVPRREPEPSPEPEPLREGERGREP